jgi:hypothetical protein
VAISDRLFLLPHSRDLLNITGLLWRHRFGSAGLITPG